MEEDHKESGAEDILDGIIESALKARASDVHIDPTENGLKVFFRLDGQLSLRMEFPIRLHESIMQRIKVLARLPVDDKRLPKDGKFKWTSTDGTLTAEVRVSMMPTTYGENAVLRLFDPLISIFSLKELGFSDAHAFSLERALAMRSGLIMLAGPTGSGKSTTLYSILSRVRDSSRLVIAIEDPVERRIAGIRQIEVGGASLLEYVSVLRSVLRQDPDVIMIGEIRDREAAELAIQSALTGHLVISTLHAPSAFGVRQRLCNMGVAEYLVDATLVCVMSQRLVRKICVGCKEEEKDLTLFEGWLQREKIETPHSILYKGKGCDRCAGSGVSGRMVVSEMLDEGIPMHMDALSKAFRGLIPFPEVIHTHA